MTTPQKIHKVVSALESLTDAFASLSTTGPKPRITDSALKSILRWLDPVEYHMVAPLVSRQWWRCVRRCQRGWRPRVVLMNLVIDETETEKGDMNASVAEDDKKKKWLITNPMPLEYWTCLPKEYCPTTQCCMAGEGVVVKTRLENVPTDAEGFRKFLNGVLGMLVLRLCQCGKHNEDGDGHDTDGDGSDEDGYSHSESESDLGHNHDIPNISVIPWQITLTPPVFANASNLETLRTILPLLSPRVLQIHTPSKPILKSLLPTSSTLRILRLLDIHPTSIPDLTSIPQLKNLVRLELGGIPHKNTPPSENNVPDLSPFPKTSLRSLYICPNLPLPPPSTLFETLSQIPSLCTLHIPAYPTSTEILPPPQLLARLTDFSPLQNPPSTYLSTLKSTTLTTLTIHYTNTTPQTLPSLLQTLHSSIPSLKYPTLKFTHHDLTVGNILSILERIRHQQTQSKKGGTWRNVRIQGVEMRVSDVSVFAGFNLKDGFGVIWET